MFRVRVEVLRQEFKRDGVDEGDINMHRGHSAQNVHVVVRAGCAFIAASLCSRRRGISTTRTGEDQVPLYPRAVRLIAALRFLALLAVLACAGCALTYVDADGTRHVIGLVDVSVRSPGASQTLAGDVV